MKRKVLSLLLVLSLVLSFISLPVFAAEYSLSQEIQSFDYSGSTLSVTAKITNSGDVKASVNGYAAVYSSADELKGVNSITLSLSANKSTTVVYEISNYDYTAGDYIKAFLWDESLAPIGECVESPVIAGDQIEGIILETHLSSPLYEEGYNTVSILVTKSLTDEYAEGAILKLVNKTTNVTDYLGYTVTATVNNYTLLDVMPKDGANALITLDTDLINDITEDSIVYYKSNTTKYSTEAEIQTSVTINGIKTDTSDYFIVINGFNSNYEYIPSFFDIVYVLDEITLLDNNDDGNFEFIFANIPTLDAVEFVVESIEVEENFYVFESKEDYLELDCSDSDMHITVIKDGTVTTLDAISEGDVITCLDASVPVLTIYASSVKIEGTVVEVDDDIHTINETDYKLSPLSDIEHIDAGTSGTFYINAFGKIARVELPPLDYKYFYLTDTAITEDSFEGAIYLVKGITESGAEVTYTINSRNVDVYTPDGNATKVTAATAYRYFEEYTGLLKIVLDDNSKLTTAVFPDASDDFITNDRYEYDAEDMSSSYNQNRGTYGIIDLSPDTVIFNVNTTDGTVTTSTVAQAFTHGSSYSFISYGAEDEIAPVLVTYNLNLPEGDIEPVIGESEYVFLIDYAQMTDAFDEAAYYVQIMTNDGVIDPYLINSKNVSIYTKDGVTSSLTNEESYGIVSSYIGVAKIALTEDGKIAEFYLPDCEEFSENVAYENTSAQYNAQNLTLGTASIDNETVLYNIDSAEEDLDAALSAYNAYKVLEDGASYCFISYGKNGEAADIILMNDLKIPSNAEETAMVITKVADAIVNSTDAIKVTGVKDGVTTSVYVSPLDYEDLNLQAGNVIIYTLDNGYATDIQLLFNSTDEASGELSENLNGILTDQFSDEYVTIHYGEITEKTSKYVTIDEDKFYFFDEVNVIVVDYTGVNVSITSGTLTSVKVSNAKFKRTAFVKTIPEMEDEISDIVVFVEAAE